MDKAPEKRHVEEKTGSHPVMDVVPPKSTETPKEPPKDDAPKVPPVGASESELHATAKKPAVHKPMSQKTPGVGLAIVATVIIVLGLAVLFVYAYLRSNNLSTF